MPLVFTLLHDYTNLKKFWVTRTVTSITLNSCASLCNSNYVLNSPILTKHPNFISVLIQLRERNVAVTDLHIVTTSKVKLPFVYNKMLWVNLKSTGNRHLFYSVVIPFSTLQSTEHDKLIINKQLYYFSVISVKIVFKHGNYFLSVISLFLFFLYWPRLLTHCRFRWLYAVLWSYSLAQQLVGLL